MNKPPFIDYLQQHNSSSVRIFSPDSILYPDTNAVFNINDVRNLDAVWPKYYYDYLKEFVEHQIDNSAMRFTGLYDMNTTEPAQFINNNFFDLLGVKYILTYKDMDYFYQVFTVDSVLRQLTDLKDKQQLNFFTLDGSTRPVIFEHAPNKITVSLTKPKEARYLILNPALSENTFDHSNESDGVSFVAQAKEQNNIIATNQLTVTPQKNNKHWFTLKLGPFPDNIGKFSLTLQTDQITNNFYDWSGWGGFTWDNDPNNTNSTQFKKIYDKEVKIYENSRAVPRLHPISEVKCVNDEKAIFPTMVQNEANISTLGIGIGTSCKNQIFDTTKVKLSEEKFDDQKVSFSYSSSAESYIVLSNQYYPGWKVKINGASSNISRINYTFQGLKLPKNSNGKVEVYYDSDSFKLGLWLTLGSLIISLLALFRFGIVNVENLKLKWGKRKR